MNAVNSRLAILSACLLLTAPLRGAAQPDTLMGFLARFIGEWYAVPDAEMLKDFPEMANSVGFKFEWAHPDKKILRFYEGIPQGDMSKRILETLVAVNPRTGEVEFLGYQLRNDFLFKGRFEPIDQHQGFIRLYDVYYPHGTQFRHKTDEMKGMKSYRDICHLIASDTLECTTEQFDFGQYKPWGKGKPYRMVRRVSSATAQNANHTAGLGALTGSWLSHLDEKYRDHAMIKKFNPELKPQLLKVAWAEDRSFLHLAILNIDRPALGDTTLFVKGFIVPNPTADAATMLEHNVGSGATYSGKYQLDGSDNIIRQFADCATGSDGRKFKELWKWTDPTKMKFEWHTYSYRNENNEYVKGDVVVEWKKIK